MPKAAVRCSLGTRSQSQVARAHTTHINAVLLLSTAGLRCSVPTDKNCVRAAAAGLTLSRCFPAATLHVAVERQLEEQFEAKVEALVHERNLSQRRSSRGMLAVCQNAPPFFFLCNLAAAKFLRAAAASKQLAQEYYCPSN